MVNPIRTVSGSDSYDCAASGGQNVDACGRAYLKDALQAGCDAACAAGGGTAALAPLCGPLAGVLSQYAYPIARDLLVGFGSGVQKGIMALVPQGWTAHGIKSAANISYDVWISSDVVGKWQQAQQAVQAAWDQGRAQVGLAPASIKVDIDLLVPNDTKDRLVAAPVASDGSALPAYVAFLDSSSSHCAASPADCLYHWLYSSKTGWLSTHTCSSNTSEGQANVWFSNLSGSVEDGDGGVDGGDINVWIGTGPFGLHTDNWPHDLQDSDAQAFMDCVVQMYSLRLQALQRGLPEVLAAVAQQIIRDKNAQWSPTAKAGTAAAVGAVGYGIWAYHGLIYDALKTAYSWTIKKF